MSRIKYYWEDLAPGSVRELGTVTVSADDIKKFAQQFDPQPFHIDEAAASNSMFGVENLRWLKPGYPGDTLRLTHTIVESRPLHTRADTGLVRARWDMFNQNGEQVLQMQGYGMFGRREPARAEEIASLQATPAKG